MSELRILTNMAFWQSESWMRAVDSIYDLSARRDPAFIPWWREALVLWLKAPRYDAVVTMGVRESMAYGLLCLLTGRPAKQIMCEVFIDAPQPGWRWRFKTACYCALASRAIGLLANSSAEVDAIARRYQIPASRVRYVPLNSTISVPFQEVADDGYILTAGRTLRDYPTLVAAATKLHHPWIVICGKDDPVEPDIYPGFEVYREVSRTRYLEMLRKCRLLVLPLLPAERATGQVVLMEAMSMGKPVIATRNPGTLDHVEHGRTGWLVEPLDVNGLTEAIELAWRDQEARTTVAMAAVSAMRERASANEHARAKLTAIASLCEGLDT
ncbi:MAG TPA: glycosyltransferase family 4 protein [Kiritimatiellia bacterium]|mgnify:CR=1 FL=1|nr:glycosyltransferase family 4 protein [Kiritimatiellia bacterium]